MNKYVLAGVFFLIFAAGVAIILNHQSVSVAEVFRGLSNLSPRVLSFLALPVIAVVFVVGVHLHKRSEERMWKNAVKKTRSSRKNTSNQS